MKKKIFSLFFAILLIVSLPFSVLAKENATGVMASLVKTSAKAGMLISMDTGDILYQKNIDAKVYPASITKIMTVTVMLESERFQPKKKLKMTNAVEPYITGTGSAVSNLRAGETLTQKDLMYLVLMTSFGDCAYLGALYFGDTVENFMKMMNDKAQELGLTGTHYGNPVGLHDPQTYTTVRDICTLTQYSLKNKWFKKICESASYTMPATNYSDQRTLTSTNMLMLSNTNCYYPYAAGVKTGFTDEAGRCLVSTATKNDMRYLCILMGCPDVNGKHFTDTISLYQTAFSSFEIRTVGDLKEPVAEMPVELSLDTDHAELYLKTGYDVLLPRDADDSTVRVEPHLKAESVEAPVHKGDLMGTADIIYGEEVRGTVELIAGDDIARSKLLLIKKYAESVWKVVLYIVLAAVVLIVVLIFVIFKMNHKRKRKVRYIPYRDDE